MGRFWFGGHFQIRERAELDPYDVVASPRVAMSSGDVCVCVQCCGAVSFPYEARQALAARRLVGFSAAYLYTCAP